MTVRESDALVGNLRDDDRPGNYESNPALREEFLNIARSRGNGHLS